MRQIWISHAVYYKWAAPVEEKAVLYMVPIFFFSFWGNRSQILSWETCELFRLRGLYITLPEASLIFPVQKEPVKTESLGIWIN